MHDVDKLGIGKVMELALKHVDPQNNSPIHLSFDIDSLDPQYCPSTGTKVAGGLTYREGNYVCEALAKTGRLVSMDLAEFNPKIFGCPNDIIQTAEVSIVLVRAALGLKIKEEKKNTLLF